MIKKYLHMVRNILILALIAILIGTVTGFIDALFGDVLNIVTTLRMTYPYYLIPFLGFIGIFIIWSYKRFGGSSHKGMSLIFEVGHGKNIRIPIRLIPFSIIGTWLTHLFGGSAGREGVAIQIGGTVANTLGRLIPIPLNQKLLLIVGMAAGFGGLFRTPIAAAFFAMEVLTAGILELESFLPALIASYTASFFSGLWGVERFSMPLLDHLSFSGSLILKFLIVGITFGMAGCVFSYARRGAKHLLAKWFKNPFTRILVIGILISTLSLLLWGGRYSGLGTNLIQMSFSGDVIYSWDFLLKIFFTVLTLGAGFQGGEVTPLFAIGATLGVVLASLLGLPLPLIAALGYAAVFGSATNTLLAPILIGGEIFGFSYLPYFIIVCTIAYLTNGNRSIYPLQKHWKEIRWSL